MINQSDSEIIFLRVTLGVFDWSSSVTYVLTDWTCLTILYSSGTGNEAMRYVRTAGGPSVTALVT